jgi:hypothetical protein
VIQPTTPSSRQIARLLLPLALLALMLWLLVGCFYMPWFEHPIANNARNVDFRPMLADEWHTDRPIRVGSVTRHQVIQLLGAPKLAAVDRSAFVYDFQTVNAFWVWPLCFAAEPANGRLYVAVLSFDDAGMLQRIDVTDANEEIATWLYAVASRVSEREIAQRFEKPGVPIGRVARVPAGGPWFIIVPPKPTTRRGLPPISLPTDAPAALPVSVPLEP